MGKSGKWLAEFSVMSTLVGVSIIFLILIGLLLNGTFDTIPRGFWTLVVGGALLLFAIMLPSLNEIKYLR
jgi:amino acid permease